MVYIRFWKRIRLSRRTYLNIAKKGLSLTLNLKWFRITFGKNGMRISTGLRGTGLSLTEYKKYKK